MFVSAAKICKHCNDWLTDLIRRGRGSRSLLSFNHCQLHLVKENFLRYFHFRVSSKDVFYTITFLALQSNKLFNQTFILQHESMICNEYKGYIFLYTIVIINGEIHVFTHNSKRTVLKRSKQIHDIYV